MPRNRDFDGSHELVLRTLLVPHNLAIVLERKRRHVSRNGRLLAHFRRCDHLLIAANGFHPIAEMVDGAIPLAEILGTVQVHHLPRLHPVRRLAAE